MKKTVSVFLVLTIFIVCIIGSAIAEDFSVRNGIKFGMSKKEVNSIEKSIGSIKLGAFGEFPDILEYEGSVAGEESIIQYCFSENGLTLINYDIGKGSAEKKNISPSREDMFYSLKDTLTKKYGEPVSSDNTIIPDSLNGDLLRLHRKTAAFDKNEWLVEYDNYFVIILETIDTEKGKLPGSTFNYTNQPLNLTYLYITKEEIAARSLLDKLEAEEQERIKKEQEEKKVTETERDL